MITSTINITNMETFTKHKTDHYFRLALLITVCSSYVLILGASLMS